jgi:DNA-binding CsgD family transcriptional regulator
VSSDAATARSPGPPVVALGTPFEGPPLLADVHAAARRLLALVRQLPAESSGNGIVLDVVVDGVRCVVTLPTPRTGNGHDGQARTSAPSALTPREQEIARMVAEGRTNKEIASVLEISSWTVSTHLRRIFGKLDVGTRAAMVARLARR